jgi:DNA-binding MarR family transcriptional regulator
MSDSSAKADRDQQCEQAVASCACLHLRKASRAVTQLFDELLQPTGLRSTQFVILVAVRQTGPINIGQLARELVMERTTLMRNLKPLEQRELVATGAAGDKRTKLVELPDEGEQAVAEALPYWEKAQTRLLNELGEDRWQQMVQQLNATVKAARST